MNQTSDRESRAISNLIEEIDRLDAWRDRVGRRVIAAFLVTFAVALGLLVYVALYEGTPHVAPPPPGSRAAIKMH